MPFYRDSVTFCATMTDIFGRIMAVPEMSRLLADSRTVLCIKTTGPDAVLILDASTMPPRFLTGEACGGAVDLGLRLSVDTLHAILLGDVRLRDAFAARQLHLESNPLRALALLSRFEAIFRYAERLYPIVLSERGLL